jgi:hypothetical protein
MQKEVHPLKASKNEPYFGKNIVQKCSIHFFVNSMFDEDSVDWSRQNLHYCNSENKPQYYNATI